MFRFNNLGMCLLASSSYVCCSLRSYTRSHNPSKHHLYSPVKCLWHDKREVRKQATRKAAITKRQAFELTKHNSQGESGDKHKTNMSRLDISFDKNIDLKMA